MKKLFFPTLLLGLLLCACGGSGAADTPAPTPVVSSAPPTAVVSTPSPAPDAESAWWEGLDPAQLPDTMDAPAQINGVTCFWVASAEDARLYCAVDSEAGGWLLRRGDTVSYFPAPMEAVPATPRMQWGDFDADGTAELLILYSPDPHASDLHLYEWDDGWTDRHFGPEVYTPILLSSLDYQYQPYTATVTCGRQTASYTLGAGEGGGDVPLWDSFGDLLFYRVEDLSITAVFGVGVKVGGQPRYFATLTGDVDYNGSGFSLLNLRLTATGGV